jgi:hypothetical protein
MVELPQICGGWEDAFSRNTAAMIAMPNIAEINITFFVSGTAMQDPKYWFMKRTDLLH